MKEAFKLAERLMELYRTGKVDQVELLYHHFKNTATQIITQKVYLPLSLSAASQAEPTGTDYILEPSAEGLQELLFPKLLKLTIYTTLLDTATSEHAARMMAMQTANDNAKRSDSRAHAALQQNAPASDYQRIAGHHGWKCTKELRTDK